MDFLNTYCVGFDEDTMPESAKGQNKSYYDYIMGTGYDMVEKTPEWAEPHHRHLRPLAFARLANEASTNAQAPLRRPGLGPRSAALTAK